MPKEMVLSLDGDNIKLEEIEGVKAGKVELTFLHYRAIDGLPPFNSRLRELAISRYFPALKTDQYGHQVFDNSVAPPTGLTGEQRDYHENGALRSTWWACDDSEGQGGWVRIYLKPDELKKLGKQASKG